MSEHKKKTTLRFSKAPTFTKSTMNDNMWYDVSDSDDDSGYMSKHLSDFSSPGSSLSPPSSPEIPKEDEVVAELPVAAEVQSLPVEEEKPKTIEFLSVEWMKKHQTMKIFWEDMDDNLPPPPPGHGTREGEEKEGKEEEGDEL